MVRRVVMETIAWRQRSAYEVSTACIRAKSGRVADERCHARLRADVISLGARRWKPSRFYAPEDTEEGHLCAPSVGHQELSLQLHQMFFFLVQLTVCFS